MYTLFTTFRESIHTRPLRGLRKLDALFISEESLQSHGLSNQTDLELVEYSVHRNVAINSVDFNKTVDRVNDSIQDGMFGIHFQ